MSRDQEVIKTLKDLPNTYLSKNGTIPWANVTGKPTTFAPSSHSHSYLPLAGGTLTGNIAHTMHGSTQTPLKIYGGDANGQGISIGAGAATIISSGEGRGQIEANVPATEETMVIGSDNSIQFHTSLQEGWAARKTMIMERDGRLTNNNGFISGLNTGTYLAGNQGKALINSTASAGSYVMLNRYCSTNGFFTIGGYQGKYLMQYTTKGTVDAGTNSVTKAATLLDEGGNSYFPGTVNAGNLQVGGANVYHTGRKPTPADIGAAASSHNHNKIVTSNSGGVYEGNGDNATSTIANIQIKSWFGIGFGPSISGQPVPQNQNAVWINCRSGDMGLRGKINASGLIESTSYITTPTSVCDRIQGRSSANRVYIGSGNCRLDTNENYFRVFTSKVGTNDYGLRINPSGGFSVMVNSVGKHEFNASGTKTGGSIEIEGMTYGMSPIDSPKYLIEDILFDIDVKEEGTIVELNNIFAKSINGKYAVFTSNGKTEVTDKEFNSFKVLGYTGKIDIRIIGIRIEYENDYYKIMGGFEHGTETEVVFQ